MKWLSIINSRFLIYTFSDFLGRETREHHLRGEPRAAKIFNYLPR